MSLPGAKHCVCVDINKPDNIFHFDPVYSMVDRVLHYNKSSEDAPIKVYCEPFSMHSDTEEFDTIGIFYAVTPEGKTYAVNRFFSSVKDRFAKDWKPGTWIEINLIDYTFRRSMNIRKRYNL